MNSAADATAASATPATPSATPAPPAAWHRRARVIAQDWLETEGQRWVFVLKTLLAAFLALWTVSYTHLTLPTTPYV